MHIHRHAHAYIQVYILTQGLGSNKSIDPFSVFTFVKAAVFAVNSKDSYDKHTITHKTMNERLDS